MGGLLLQLLKTNDNSSKGVDEALLQKVDASVAQCRDALRSIEASGPRAREFAEVCRVRDLLAMSK
jgi:hypothetical protein